MSADPRVALALYGDGRPLSPEIIVPLALTPRNSFAWRLPDPINSYHGWWVRGEIGEEVWDDGWLWGKIMLTDMANSCLAAWTPALIYRKPWVVPTVIVAPALPPLVPAGAPRVYVVTMRVDGPPE